MEKLTVLKKKILSCHDFGQACGMTVRGLRKQIGHYHWIGIYMVEGKELVLKAWDGPQATEHVRIPIGKGICGTAAATGTTIIVDDVNKDPRYLQCFLETRSEIVVPIKWGGDVIGEIDIDSNKAGAFHTLDRLVLEDLAKVLANAWEVEEKHSKWGSQTLLLREGETAPEGLHPVNFPLVQSSTYEFPSMADLESYLSDQSQGYIYSRWGNPTVEAVEQKLAFLETAEQALLFSSGMGAISTTLLTFLKAGDELITLENLYGGTSTFFSDVLEKLGIQLTSINLKEFHDLRRVITSKTKVIYFETLTNPTLRVVNPAEAVSPAREQGILVVVDNTMASPYHLRPLSHGVDIVIESATKGLSGHSDVTGGMVAGKKELIEKVKQTRKIIGTCFNAWEALLLSRGLKTFFVRMKEQSETALYLAQKLEKHRMIKTVFYPGLLSHPEHDLARSLFQSGFGGIFTLKLDGGMEAVKAFVDNLRLWKRAASFGSAISLVSIPVLTSHWGTVLNEKKEGEVTANMVRFSAGLEKKEDLLSDIQQALESLRKVHVLMER